MKLRSLLGALMLALAGVVAVAGSADARVMRLFQFNALTSGPISEHKGQFVIEFDEDSPEGTARLVSFEYWDPDSNRKVPIGNIWLDETLNIDVVFDLETDSDFNLRIRRLLMELNLATMSGAFDYYLEDAVEPSGSGQVAYIPVEVAEPAPLALAGAGLAGLGLVALRRRKRA